MLTHKGIEVIQNRLRKATLGPWKWSATKGWPGPQLEGNIQHEDMNPILVTTGCAHKHDDPVAVDGCMPEKFNDPLRACPLHPSNNDREFIANAYSDIELLLDHIKSLKV